MLHRALLPRPRPLGARSCALRYVVDRRVPQLPRRVRLPRRRRCCAGCGGCAPGTAPTRSSCWPRPRSRDPAAAAAPADGLPVAAVTEDASPRGALGLRPLGAAADRLSRRGAARRRRRTRDRRGRPTCSPTWSSRAPGTLAFVRSRRGAETVALDGPRRPSPRSTASLRRPGRGLPRRATCPRSAAPWRRRCAPASCAGLAATNALELGVDVSGLDAVVIAGYPGTRASLWQQAGRAGRGRAGRARRAGRPGRPAGHLPRAPSRGAVRPARRGDRARPGQPVRPGPAPVRGRGRAAAHRGRPGPVRPARPPGCVGPRRGRHCCATRPPAGSGPAASGPPLPGDIRGARRRPGAGRRGGHRPAARAPSTRGSAHTPVHEGAVYLHQGETYLVDDARPGRRASRCVAAATTRTTRPSPATITDIAVLGDRRSSRWGADAAALRHRRGHHQVVSFLRRRPGDRRGPRRGAARPALRAAAHPRGVVDASPPASGLAAAAGSTSRRPRRRRARRGARLDRPAAAVRDLRPLGHRRGVHPAPPRHALPTVFVYDGHPGGAGFAERGLCHGARAGCARPATPSPPARAPTAARPASSPPSAATATTPWTRPAPWPARHRPGRRPRLIHRDGNPGEINCDYARDSAGIPVPHVN